MKKRKKSLVGWIKKGSWNSQTECIYGHSVLVHRGSLMAKHNKTFTKVRITIEEI